MRRKIGTVIIVVAACLFFSGCDDRQTEMYDQKQESSTLAAQFVENSSELELKNIVRYANCLLIGPVVSFDDVDELPMLNILNMYCAVQTDNMHDDQREIRLNELEDFTRSYFGDGVFNSKELLEDKRVMLQIEDGIIHTNGFGNMPGYLAGTIDIDSVMCDGDSVKIAVHIVLDQEGKDKAQGELTLKITDEGYQYAAYQFTERPWTIADLEIPTNTPLTMDQVDTIFGELKSSQIFVWEAEAFGEKRIYNDGTEVMLYLGEKESATGVIQSVITSRVDLPLIKGVKVGDAM